MAVLEAQRCEVFAPLVRAEARRTLGADYPWHYNLGQLQQESRCRASVTAFDGGMGLAQFMPKTALAVQRKFGEELDPYRPADAIRLQALLLSDLQRQSPVDRLWPVFQAYNGGWGPLRQEAKRAGIWQREKMAAECQRKKIILKNGSLLDFCKVNYDYSQQVFRYGSRFRTGPDMEAFW